MTKMKHNWPQLVTAFQSSNLSKVEFCTHHNLALSTFSKWVNRLSQPLQTNGITTIAKSPYNSRAAGPGRSAGGDFTVTTIQNQYIEINYKHIVIKVPLAVEAGTLTHILSALQ